MTFIPPTKRSNGQCTCHFSGLIAKEEAAEGMHQPDCPALYPLQPKPGDTPACTCNESERMRRGDTSLRRDAHYPECPRAQWLDAQRGADGHPSPGDEPDTLTRLTRHIREQYPRLRIEWDETALALIFEAAEERKALKAEVERLSAASREK